MNLDESYIIKGKCIITISIALVILSVGLVLAKNNKSSNINYDFSLEQINIKNMSTALVAVKKGSATSSYSPALTEIPYETEKLVNNTTTTTAQVTQLSNTTSSRATWRLPTDHGYITQYPRYGHIALDITSNRGTYEGIYPVADGTIAAIYTDSAGALAIIINHNINGKNYMSQYVHMSSYAQGLYVGKYVTSDDRIGQMGSTGYSTGVHLHLAVFECSYLNDSNCQSLGHMYNFANYQLNSGFYGLQSVMYVPYSWTIR